MDLFWGMGALGALLVFLVCARLITRWLAPGALRRRDDGYWRSMREAEILTRNKGPFV